MDKNIHEIGIKNKKDNYYSLKALEQNPIEEIDLLKRTVKGILNTSYFIDQDNDMILPGAVKKSLNDNGVHSDATDKIKYQIDHSLKADDTIGIFKVLEEREKNGIFDLYFEGYLPPIVSDGHLIKYQSGLYTQHSIGFQYLDLTVAEKESTTELYRENWDKYYPLAINKDIADKRGYFYVVKEYKLFEGSVVTFGSNSLTAYLGSKSANKETYLMDLFNRLDFLNTIDKNKNSKVFQLEILQIKQIIKETYNDKPSIKGTLEKSLKQKDTFDNVNFLKAIKNNI